MLKDQWPECHKQTENDFLQLKAQIDDTNGLKVAECDGVGTWPSFCS